MSKSGVENRAELIQLVLHELVKEIAALKVESPDVWGQPLREAYQLGSEGMRNKVFEKLTELTAKLDSIPNKRSS